MRDVILKPGKEKPSRHHHPWVYSGAIARVVGDGEPVPGEIVRVVAADGRFIGYGYHNVRSQIAIRILDWNESAVIDDGWWSEKIAQAIHRRADLLDAADSNACRLIYAEADGLPGLIVDRYADFVVVQSQTAGIDAAKGAIVEALARLVHPVGIYERSEGTPRELEGMADAHGVLSGLTPPPVVEISENGHRFLVDPVGGHKTGFYLDQRENRSLVAPRARGRDVLDCFCYTGGFTVYVLAAGARSVIAIDSSAPALAMLRDNVRLNTPADAGPNLPQVETICGNAFEVLRRFRDQARSFDLVILDPPKLAANRSQLDRALRAYKDLNLLAFKLLRPGGVLATFSCSGVVARASFQEMVAWAATDAGREVQILDHLSQSSDHPALLSFPESEYLKGLLCRVR